MKLERDEALARLKETADPAERTSLNRSKERLDAAIAAKDAEISRLASSRNAGASRTALRSPQSRSPSYRRGRPRYQVAVDRYQYEKGRACRPDRRPRARVGR